jgi:hypothetical protein
MDPFMSTIMKRSGVILLGFAGTGLLVALMYGLHQYAQLQHAMMLNTLPPGLR